MCYPATSLDAPRSSGDGEPGETLGDTVGDADDRFEQPRRAPSCSR
jgi:hypothetical protein